MRTPGELVASVRHLASLPASFQRVKQVLDDPRGSGTQLAELIACDPGMSAAVLRVVNSAYFGIPGGVETVSHALWVLGMQRVHDIVLATSLATTFRGIPAAQMDMERYWRASVLRSVAARGAARLHGITDLERLLVEGLLADIGHLVMYLIPALAEQAGASPPRNRPLKPSGGH
ncbi:MAG: HDOD domain-containing protein [Burkholderiales bacterium]|nr:HDOD domain-containing protein [Burkholderiales bacterium]